jgi:Ca2+-binding RTX toxin-like protein
MGRTRLSLASLALAAGIAVIAGTSATAGTEAISCSYETAGQPGPRGNYLQIVQPVGSGPATISRSGEQVTVDASSRVDCSGRAATIENIDRILLLSESTRRLKLDLRSGGLSPGASEKEPGAEIELFLQVTGTGDRQLELTVLAGKGDNRITIGRSQRGERINLNPLREPRDDTDVFIDPVNYQNSGLRVGLGAGDDTVDGRGPGVLEPSALTGFIHDLVGDNLIYATAAENGNQLHTGTGRDILRAAAHSDPLIGGDVLTGGARRDELYGFGGPDRIDTGPGDDIVSAGDGDDLINASDDGSDQVDCGPGHDAVAIGGGDRVRRNCENVVTP